MGDERSQAVCKARKTRRRWATVSGYHATVTRGQHRMRKNSSRRALRWHQVTVGGASVNRRGARLRSLPHEHECSASFGEVSP